MLFNRELEEKEIANEFAALALSPLGTENRPAGPGKMDISRLKFEKMYSSLLKKKEDLKDWVLEGGGRAEIRDGKLYLENPTEKKENGHQVFWNKTDFPENFIAKWHFEKTQDPGLGIVFFATQGTKGEDIFDFNLEKRDGDFKQYHSRDIHGYHISYFSGGRGTTNLRKNSGMHLGAIGNDLISDLAIGKTVEVILVKCNNHIQLAVDGWISLDYKDDGKLYGPAHGSGKIGFRQMAHTKAAWYSNFEVFNILEGDL